MQQTRKTLRELLNMTTDQEITDRKRVIVMLAGGRPEALAMDSDALDREFDDFLINLSVASGAPEDEDEAESYYRGVEMALYAAALDKLTA